MSEIILEQISIYPIKSLGAVALQSAECLEKGFRLDRRYMLTTPDGCFLTQRTLPVLACFTTSITESGIIVKGPVSGSSVTLPFSLNASDEMSVNIWEDTLPALAAGQAYDQWFSREAGIACRLVFMPEQTPRLLSPKYAVHGESVSFADGMPYLLTTTASLADLNSRLENPVPMDRFRPNLVISGTEAWAEDSWESVSVGEAVFKLTKPCARCVVTTIDQKTGEGGIEPLKTLAGFRKQNNKVLFGQNMLLLHGHGFRISVGDSVSINAT
jgi:uncharacterized protein YcbX